MMQLEGGEIREICARVFIEEEGKKTGQRIIGLVSNFKLFIASSGEVAV